MAKYLGHPPSLQKISDIIIKEKDGLILEIEGVGKIKVIPIYFGMEFKPKTFGTWVLKLRPIGRFKKCRT